MANYLYNGVELPPLPEWDKEAYPYAYLNYSPLFNMYGLWCSKTPAQYDADDAYFYIDNPSIDCSCHSPYSAWLVWSEHTDSGGFLIGQENPDMENPGGDTFKLIWCNYDVSYSDGTVFLAASDPIPVTTAAPIDPTAFMQGWLVGKKIAAMRGKANTAVPVTITWDGNTEGLVHSTGYYECFYKVSDLVPTMAEFNDVQFKSLTTDGEVYESGQLTNIVVMDNGVIWAGDFVARVVPAAGLSANIAGQECTFPEPGIYFCLWNGFFTAELTYTTTV